MSTQVTELRVEPTAVAGLAVLHPKAVTDERGTVREFFRASALAAAGLAVPERWHQLNVTTTGRGGLRGLHGEAMTKLVGIAAGEAFGAYVDARPGSPTRGAVATVALQPGTQVLVPPGVCNGFQATGAEGCVYVYCFDAEWMPGMAGVALDPLDPALGIAWPLPVDRGDPAQISAKDAAAPPLAAVLGDAAVVDDAAVGA